MVKVPSGLVPATSARPSSAISMARRWSVENQTGESMRAGVCRMWILRASGVAENYIDIKTTAETYLRFRYHILFVL